MSACALALLRDNVPGGTTENRRKLFNGKNLIKTIKVHFVSYAEPESSLTRKKWYMGQKVISELESETHIRMLKR